MNNSNVLVDIPQIIGEYFIRVCKNHNVYHVFQKRFRPQVGLHMYKTPFDTNAHCLTDMFMTVGNHVNNHIKDMRRHSGDKYEPITIIINTLMQYYLEGGGVNPSILGELGQEIFNLSCYRIYGQSFLDDMERERQSNPDMNMNPTNEFEKFAFAQYRHFYDNQMFGGTFNEFVSSYRTALEHAWRDYSRKRSRKNR